MRPCRFCGDDVTSPNPECDFCRHCYYAGRVLAHNMSGVCDVLEVATGTDWIAQHTGGGCFWLCTTIMDLPATEPDGEPTTRMIIVTEWPDVLTGTATLADIEVPDEHGGGGWFVGAETDYWHEGPARYWPTLADERLYGLHTEELPMVVREAAEWLRSVPIPEGGR